MNDFLNQVYFDNTVRKYAITLGIILFVLLLNRIISKYLAGLLFTFVKRIWKDIDKKSFVDLVIHPVSLFIVVFVSIVALHKLTFPAVWNVEIYTYTVKEIIHAFATSILIVCFIWLLLRTIDFIATIL